MARLRDRKKRRTRQELASAALELFSEQGFDATTVDEIVDQVEVSRSTFFRYFPTKEHVLFADHDEQLRGFRRSLADLPSDGPSYELIRSVVFEASSGTIAAYAADPETYRTRQRIIAGAPSIGALALRLDLDWEDALAEALERWLPGPAEDRYAFARLLAGSLMGTVEAFHRMWGETGFTRDPAEFRDGVMAVFERGLTGVFADAGEEPPAPAHDAVAPLEIGT